MLSGKRVWAQLVGDRDDDRIRRNVIHVLHPLLPNQRTYTHALRT